MHRILEASQIACRSLARSPRFLILAVATLAMGIAAVGTFFGVYDAILLRPLAYGDSERLVTVLQPGRSPTSPANFEDLRRDSRTVSQWTAATPWSPVLRGEGPAEQLPGLRTTADLFQLLRVQPLMGRTYDASDRGERVLVISHELWRHRFGAEPGIVGKSLELDGEDHTVIGVMPESFAFPPFWATEARYWTIFPEDPELWADRDASFLRAFGRLADGVSVEAAQSEIDGLAARLRTQHPEHNDELTYVVEPMAEPVVEPIRPALHMLLAGVGMVLLIACANVFALWLVRGAARRRELALRRALGAGSPQLWRHGLAESLVVVSLAWGLGWMLALWALEALKRVAPPGVPRLSEAVLDHRVLILTAVVCWLLALIFALFLPLASRGAPASSLAGAGSRTDDRGLLRGRSCLVTFEVALSLLLLLTSGLMVKSLLNLWQLDPGMRTEGVLTAHLPFGGSEVAEPELQGPFLDRLLEHVSALPGVESAGLINHLHLGGDIWRGSYEIEGLPMDDTSDAPKASFRVTSPGFFSGLEIPLLQGRDFSRRDNADTTKVVIVSRRLAERHWPGESAVGKRLKFFTGGDDWLEIVGVVGDVRQWNLTDELRSAIYFPYGQNPAPWWTQTSLVVTTSGDESAVFESVGAGLRQIKPEVPVTQPRTLRQIYGEMLWQPRFVVTLLTVFALMALALAAIGVYGALSYAAASRRRELGVRLALGAHRRDLVLLLLVRGMIPTAVGLGFGLGLFLLLGGFLESRLHGVTPQDPITLGVVIIGLSSVALLAGFLPAQQASRLDPVVSLRQD